MRLNLGCGTHRMPREYGWVNVDKDPSVQPDALWPAEKLPLDPGAVEEILAIHLIESYYQWQLPDVLREWHRVLGGNGRLVIEGTDLETTMRMALSENPDVRRSGEWGLYGRQDVPEPNVDTLHKYVWRPTQLADVLREIGFVVTHIGRATTHDTDRDFRIEARR